MMAMAGMAMAMQAPVQISSCQARSVHFASSFCASAASSSLSSSRAFSGMPSLRVFFNNVMPVSRKRTLRLVVRAGKASMACTKRSRSRKSRARAQGFRARMATPGGRNVLRRRRRKGRKVLVPQSNPNSGKRA